jgi:hypothetical protein
MLPNEIYAIIIEYAVDDFYNNGKYSRNVLHPIVNTDGTVDLISVIPKLALVNKCFYQCVMGIKKYRILKNTHNMPNKYLWHRYHFDKYINGYRKKFLAKKNYSKANTELTFKRSAQNGPAFESLSLLKYTHGINQPDYTHYSIKLTSFDLMMTSSNYYNCLELVIEQDGCSTTNTATVINNDIYKIHFLVNNYYRKLFPLPDTDIINDTELLVDNIPIISQYQDHQITVMMLELISQIKYELFKI